MEKQILRTDEREVYESRYRIQRFNHSERRNVPVTERFKILEAILSCVGQEVGGDNINEREKKIIAVASYPIADLYTPKIDRRCNWMIIKSDGKTVGVILEYKGQHNDRYICYGTSEVIYDFIRYYPNSSGVLRIPGDFRPVLPVSSFPEQELPTLLGPKWSLRDNKAQKMTRIATDQDSYRRVTSGLKPINLPDGWSVRELTEDDRSLIYELLKSSYPQHSFRSHKNHHGVISSDGEVIAMSGVVGFAYPPGMHPIALTGDLVTRKGYERHGYATVARIATLKHLFDPKNPFFPAIVVSDANEFSLPVNIKLGFTPVKEYWWCIYRKTI